MMYNPRERYWLVQSRKAPNNIFSGAKMAYVSEDDEGHRAFAGVLKRVAPPSNEGDELVNIYQRAVPILCDGNLAEVLLKRGMPRDMIIAAGVSVMPPCYDAHAPSDLTKLMDAIGCQVGEHTYAVDQHAEASYHALLAVARGGGASWPGYVRDIDRQRVALGAEEAATVLTKVLAYCDALDAAISSWADGGEWKAPERVLSI